MITKNNTAPCNDIIKHLYIAYSSLAELISFTDLFCHKCQYNIMQMAQRQLNNFSEWGWPVQCIYRSMTATLSLLDGLDRWELMLMLKNEDK